MEYWKVSLVDGNPLQAKWLFLEKSKEDLLDDLEHLRVVQGDCFYTKYSEGPDLELIDRKYRIINMSQVSMIEPVVRKVVLL